MLGAIALVFMRDGQELALAFAVAAIGGSFLVPYARAKAEGLGIKGDVGIGSRAERVIVIFAGLVLAPWGVLPWAIGVLAVTAWFTVLQRILHVRRELRSSVPRQSIRRRARARSSSGCRACGRRARGGTRSSSR